jgi:hypothetical protein
MQPDDLDHDLGRFLAAEREAIPDDGFTRRVQAGLPRRTPSPWVRSAVLVGMTSAGCALALFVVPGAEGLRAVLATVPQARPIAQAPWTWIILVYALCWASVSAALDGAGPRRDTREGS